MCDTSGVTVFSEVLEDPDGVFFLNRENLDELVVCFVSLFCVEDMLPLL